MIYLFRFQKQLFFTKKNKEQARKIAIEMLDLVGIPEPQKELTPTS